MQDAGSGGNFSIALYAPFTVPEGARLYRGVTTLNLNEYTGGEVFEPGDIVNGVFTGDVYVCNGYDYKLNYSYDGRWVYRASFVFDDSILWGVRVKDDSLTSYGDILESIGGVEVGAALYTFYNCANLVEPPEIPSTIKSMWCMFGGCESLSGTLVINAEPAQYDRALSGAGIKGTGLILTGTSSKLEEIARTRKF